MDKETEELMSPPTTRVERDWTQGNIFKNLLSLSWPMIINEFLWGVGSIIDMIWVGKLGSESIAGVGVAGIIMMLLMSSLFGLTTGTSALVARAVGAGDMAGANHAAQQSYIIGGVYTVTLALLGIILAEPLMILFGLEPDVVHEGAAYLRILLAGSILMAFWIIGEFTMYASGDGKTPMKISIIARILHLIFAPLLVLGWGIFPKLGVSGAALANIIAYTGGVILAFWALFGGRTRLKLTMKNFSVDFNIIRRTIKIGIPSSVSNIQRSLSNMILLWLIAPFGTLAVAGHSLCQRIEGILFLPGMGLGLASGTLVGQNLGARRPERAEKSGWMASGVVTGIMVLGSLVILLWAEEIIGIFTSEADLIEMAAVFMRIATAGYLVMGFSSVLMQSISHAGDTLPPMIFNIIMMWLVQIPLAWALPKFTGLEVLGVRWAIVIGRYVAGIAYITYFKLGRWKRKKV
ncbi:MAG: MATE family efflux transporter [Dehalococcoidales bacterium]|nr:MAG: MATE family efflux transporter [Dehalococcoidales bacterium]